MDANFIVTAAADDARSVGLFFGLISIFFAKQNDVHVRTCDLITYFLWSAFFCWELIECLPY